MTAVDGCNAFAGWELLNESGSGHAHWLGPEVVTAVSEIFALLGTAPDPRPALERRMKEIRFAARVNREQSRGSEAKAEPVPTILPQDLQDKRDVASVVKATADKLAATPENIHAAAHADRYQAADAAIRQRTTDDIGLTSEANEEIMESTALAESKQAEVQIGELLKHVRHGVVNFDALKNPHNVVGLIAVDGRRCWLRRVIQGPMHDIYLERDGVPQGVIVCTQAPTGTWVPTVQEDEIRAWLKRQPGPSADEGIQTSHSTRKELHEMVTSPVTEVAPKRDVTVTPSVTPVAMGVGK